MRSESSVCCEGTVPHLIFLVDGECEKATTHCLWCPTCINGIDVLEQGRAILQLLSVVTSKLTLKSDKSCVLRHIGFCWRYHKTSQRTSMSLISETVANVLRWRAHGYVCMP